jgi:hypothetical protein
MSISRLLMDLGLSGSGSGSGSGLRCGSRNRRDLQLRSGGNGGGNGGRSGLRSGRSILVTRLEVELNNYSLGILGTGQRVSLEEFIVTGDSDQIAVFIFILYSKISRQLLEESLEQATNGLEVTRTAVVSDAANVAVKRSLENYRHCV